MEDVVGGGGAGELVEGVEGAVEVDEEELVRELRGVGGLCGLERGEGCLDGLLLAAVVQGAALRETAAGVERAQQLVL